MTKETSNLKAYLNVALLRCTAPSATTVQHNKTFETHLEHHLLLENINDQTGFRVMLSCSRCLLIRAPVALNHHYPSPRIASNKEHPRKKKRRWARGELSTYERKPASRWIRKRKLIITINSTWADFHHNYYDYRQEERGHGGEIFPNC